MRGVTNWGVFQLPKPFRKHQVTHYTGHHFLLRFDASPRTQHSLRRTMGLDPRLIRYSVVKLGDKLEDIADVPGIAPWGSGDLAVSSKVEIPPLSTQTEKWEEMKIPESASANQQENLAGLLNLLNGKK